MSDMSSSRIGSLQNLGSTLHRVEMVGLQALKFGFQNSAQRIHAPRFLVDWKRDERGKGDSEHVNHFFLQESIYESCKRMWF